MKTIFWTIRMIPTGAGFRTFRSEKGLLPHPLSFVVNLNNATEDLLGNILCLDISGPFIVETVFHVPFAIALLPMQTSLNFMKKNFIPSMTAAPALPAPALPALPPPALPALPALPAPAPPTAAHPAPTTPLPMTFFTSSSHIVYITDFTCRFPTRTF